MVQTITGIPYFYRQFGYEYALDLGVERETYTALIPPLAEGASEPYSLRDAIVNDIPLIARLYEQQCASNIVSTVIDESWWRHQIEHWHNRRWPDITESWRSISTAANYVWFSQKVVYRQ